MFHGFIDTYAGEAVYDKGSKVQKIREFFRRSEKVISVYGAIWGGKPGTLWNGG